MASDKRKRSANWMPSEKSLLVDLVTEHFHVVENKRTDGVSIKQKLAEWAKISDKYNSQTMLCHRTAENLKAQWESLKKATKKEASFRRVHFIQTGGGPSRPKIDDPLQERILCLITPSAVGLHNLYDNDNIITPENNTISSGVHKNWLSDIHSDLDKDTIPGPEVETGTIPGPEAETKHPSESTAPSAGSAGIEYDLLNENEIPIVLVPTIAKELPDPQAQVITINSVDTNGTMNEVNWGDYTPKCLKTPVSHQLRPTQDKRRAINSGKRLEWMSKRRPQLTQSLQENLQEMKSKAIKIQMEYAAAEREEGKKLYEIQMEVQREILKQEKIKTRLLRLELQNKRK